VFDHLRALLPDGGLFLEGRNILSPCFLWTGFATEQQESETLIWRAFGWLHFVGLSGISYLILIAEANPVDEFTDAALKRGATLDSRLPSLRKDPARGMLTRFYGEEWTEAYIHGFSF